MYVSRTDPFFLSDPEQQTIDSLLFFDKFHNRKGILLLVYLRLEENIFQLMILLQQSIVFIQ